MHRCVREIVVGSDLMPLDSEVHNCHTTSPDNERCSLVADTVITRSQVNRWSKHEG